MSTRRRTGKSTEAKETFKLIQRTILDVTEKSTKESKNGQKEVWTARKGLINIILKES